MEYKSVILLSCAILSVYAQSAFALPRDSSAVKVDEIFPITDNEDWVKPPHNDAREELPTSETVIPGKISCEYEEATEDVKCMEHCLPKGYTYGLCVSNVCSCI